MITKLLCVSALLITTGFSEVQAPVEDLLRQGLFEEEANRDFDKAAERYRAVVAAHDKQRALAATATFRLGEIARKKNDKEAAGAAFRTVAERFPEQEDLARMSRENLAALGMALENAPQQPATDPFAEGPPEDPEVTEIERLKNIARNSPDLLDGGTDYGWHSMHLAAANGYTKVIAFLLENKADPNSRSTREQLTPLQVAAAHGRLGAVNALLAAKARINDEVRFGQDTIKNLPLMDKRADKAEGTWTALDFAVVYDRREVVRALIKAGADMKRAGPVLSGERASTPLSLAIRLQRENIALFLVESGVPLDAGGVKDGETPLMLAIQRMPSLVSVLLRSGADANLRGGRPQVAPLHRVAFGGNADRARELVDAGADPKIVNEAGETPLHWAGSREMVEYLVSKGADPNAKDNEGLTPLDVMVMGRIFAEPVPQFEALLANGAVIPDMDALLARTSSGMLRTVRERLVYPKYQNEDRILMSVQSHQRNDGKWVKPVEVRPADGSPPPSIAESLAMIPCEDNFSSMILNMRIIRRNAQGQFKVAFDWTPSQKEEPKVDLPPLLWGDILELGLSSNNPNSVGPRISYREESIPDRTISIRLGGVSFVRKLTDSKQFWLGRLADYLPRESPLLPRGPQNQIPGQISEAEQRSWVTRLEVLPEFIDSSRLSVIRKGVEKTIPLNLVAKDSLPFRLIDGDVIEMVLKDEFRDSLRSNNRQLVLTTDFKYGGMVDGLGLFGSVSSLEPWQPDHFGFDGTKVRVLRGGDPEKGEDFDFSKIIPGDVSEIGRSEVIEELKTSDGLQPGDWILVHPADAQTQKKSAKLAERIRMIFQTLRVRGQHPPAPGVVPQPQPQPPSARPARTRVTPPTQSR